MIKACTESRVSFFPRLAVVGKPFTLLIPPLELLHRTNSKQISVYPKMLNSWNNKRWRQNLKGITLPVNVGRYLIKSGLFIYLLTLVFLKCLHFSSSQGVLCILKLRVPDRREINLRTTANLQIKDCQQVLV